LGVQCWKQGRSKNRIRRGAFSIFPKIKLDDLCRGLWFLFLFVLLEAVAFGFLGKGAAKPFKGFC
jgi:hypothetical protein